jgi:hypothetical protein
MNSFDDFYKELTSDQLWFELLRAYKEETIRRAATKVYAALVADGTVNARPMNENRKHVYNICIKENPIGDKPRGKDWHVIKQEEKEAEEKKEWVPVSWDKRAEYLKQVQAEIDKVEDRKIRPLLSGEAEKKGQYDPPKPNYTGEPSRPIDVVIEHVNKVNAARRKFFLERKPDASEEEIEAYLQKFKVL